MLANNTALMFKMFRPLLWGGGGFQCIRTILEFKQGWEIRNRK